MSTPARLFAAVGIAAMVLAFVGLWINVRPEEIGYDKEGVVGFCWMLSGAGAWLTAFCALPRRRGKIERGT